MSFPAAAQASGSSWSPRHQAATSTSVDALTTTTTTTTAATAGSAIASAEGAQAADDQQHRQSSVSPPSPPSAPTSAYTTASDTGDTAASSVATADGTASSVATAQQSVAQVHQHNQAQDHHQLQLHQRHYHFQSQPQSVQPGSQQQQLSTATLAAPAPLSPSPSPSVANPDTRTHVVGELYDTERSYVESLQILVEKYMKPLKSVDSNRVLIDLNLVDEIFYTIPELLQHHETFLSALQDRLSSDWDTSQVIGNVFIEAFTNQQIIDTYTAFINNWKNAKHAIKVATQAKPAFEKFLEAMSREHRNKLTLDALLIMPVQRIPRYELLIKELIKHTPECHPDYGPLIEAQKQIHELALKIDRAEREMIHQEQLRDLESLIDGHAELQHPQRDFIRYDLVTILGASALTVAKKERVLFLFCDLLIMTSIKKKVSRRSNLQSAFANSTNDLSLLEGNKFKLLLRVSLDQVEIHLANDQIQLHQQQQEQQSHQIHLQQQTKLIQDCKRKIEADLHILRQMESLSSQFSFVNKNQINDPINELTGYLRQRLFSLDQLADSAQSNISDIQQLQMALGSSSNVNNQSQSSVPNASTTTPNTVIHSPSQGSNLPTVHHLGLPSSLLPISTPLISPLASNHHQHHHSQDSNASLELIISNSNSFNSNKDTNLSSYSVANANEPANEQALHGIGGKSAESSSGQTLSHHYAQHTTNSDILVVTFASIDRRQAFLQAFIEAKQQRYQLLQQQQQHNRTFGSSLVVKLGQSPDRHTYVGKDSCGSKLQHQGSIEGSSYLSTTSNLSPARNNNKSFINPTQQQLQAHQLTYATTARITSAPLGQRYGSTIVHQMSAPQSLTLVATSSGYPLDATSERSSSQCTSCSTNIILGDQENQYQRQYHHHNHPQTHHHHHQLMHQPASQPASLDTICCRESHYNDQDDQSKSGQSRQFKQLDEFEDIVQGEQYHNQDYCPHEKHGQIMSLNTDVENSSLMNQSGQHINQELFFKFAPKFTASLPMNFLNTQHPALQFTCSTPSKEQKNALNGSFNLSNKQHKRQTVKDNSGQLWLCMSNGYVSHIALISMRKKRPKRSTQADLGGYQTDSYDDSHISKANFQLIPVIQSAGDICKSHINCAAQVVWNKRKGPVNSEINESLKEDPLKEKIEDMTKEGENIEPQDTEKQKVSSVEVAIKAASPPVDIKVKPNLDTSQPEEAWERLSESAPSHDHKSAIHEKSYRSAKSPASTSRLELPPHGARRAVSQPRSLRRAADSIATHYQEASGNYDRKRSAHDAICQRHYYHDSRLVHSRLSSSVSGQQQHYRNNNFEQGGSNSCRSNHPHHHQHGHQHHHYHHHHVHHLYNARHNTVPLSELRRALERQNKISDLDFHPASVGGHHRGVHLVSPPTNTPVDPASISPNHHHQRSLGTRSIHSAEHPAAALGLHSNLGLKKAVIRASTPPASYSGSKSLRSARLLGHQASLKTSSILAKLVGGASRRTSRKVDRDKQQQKSDVEENDTDTENGKSSHQTQQQATTNASQTTDDSSSLESNIIALTTSTTNKCPMMNTLALSEPNNPVISPLSSASSLNSTNSSVAENSFCAHSPNRSASDMVFHSYPASCCDWSSHLTFAQALCNSNACSELGVSPGGCRFRSRSATFPNRKSLQIDGVLNFDSPDTYEQHQAGESAKIEQRGGSRDSSYKISEIIGDSVDRGDSNSSRIDERQLGDADSSLWLGCDDGSLIIINCLVNYSDSNNNCNFCDPNKRNLNCGNVHSEIKLSAPVCDVCTYEDKLVFVALANGQLAIFSRKVDDGKEDGSNTIWILTNPKLVTVTANELNSTSRLCLINAGHLWYSYGRNIFVLNVSTLELETTVIAPTNDLSLQLTMQPVIDHMEPMASIDGVWITFKNSHLIQLYDVKSHKLLIEINLFEPINKMLYYGNEILRHHKTACLKVTSLLSVVDERKRYNTLFIGTSAGVVLYLNITHEQLERKEHSHDGLAYSSSLLGNWVPQVACLRHGHSGQVRFLNLIEIKKDRDREIGTESESDSNSSKNNENNNESPNKLNTLVGSEEKELYLISGGAGVDIYGPSDEQQKAQLSKDVDSLNHLLLWKL